MKLLRSNTPSSSPSKRQKVLHIEPNVTVPKDDHNYVTNVFLPSPIVHIIFSFLDVKSVCRCKQASSFFASINIPNEVWMLIYCNTWKDTIWKQMDPSISWKTTAMTRIKLDNKENIVEVLAQSILHFKSHNITEQATAAFSLSKELKEIGKLLSAKDSLLQIGTIPKWLANGTYFVLHFIGDYCSGPMDEPGQSFSTAWHIYGRTGIPAYFKLKYRFYPMVFDDHKFKLSCHEKEHKFRCNTNADVSKEDALKLVKELKEFLGQPSLTVKQVSDYLVTCFKARADTKVKWPALDDELL